MIIKFSKQDIYLWMWQNKESLFGEIIWAKLISHIKLSRVTVCLLFRIFPSNN